ncbi:helix-turn-helix transcriptional regulator [Thauera aminoaromatica]|uniref:Phage transcriptional regulator, AlpA n=1 Tax=Thauera aminoaromatica TaxID=164330 RepID=C4KAH0_THASP|nr:AlpA family phage regulatory protein [Thauera aminoaromatica]ACR01396.1 phage transcriptional regulator, AlpA [Thauera aminoaromatica]
MQTETTSATPRHHTPAKNGAQQLRTHLGVPENPAHQRPEKNHVQLLRECLRVKGVAAFLGCGVATVWRRTKDDPTFPKPIKLSERVTVWKLSEIEAWVDSRRMQSTVAA